MTSQFPLSHGNDTLEAISRGKGTGGNDTISRNPYRQNLLASALPLLRSASEETQSSLPGRAKPVRAVFKDLPTAHSSITSGTARSRPRRLSNNLSEAYEEEDSIPLQDFDQPKRKNDAAQFFLDELPVPPLPAANAPRRYNAQSKNSDSCLLNEDSKFASHQQGKQGKSSQPSEPVGQPSSILANIKGAFSSISSPAATSTLSTWYGSNRDKEKQRVLNASSIYHSGLGAAPSSSLAPNTAENKPPLDPHGHPQKHSYDSYNEAIPFPDLQSTPAPNRERPSLPRQSSKTTRVLSNATSSLPEGSTVGNIYKHYAGSDTRDDIDSASDDVQSEFDLADGYFINQQSYKDYARNHGVHASPSSNNQSALYVRKQRRAERASSNPRGQAPGCALPNIPNPSPHLLPSSSQGVVNSSSYGDTNNLLDLAEPSQWIGGNSGLSRSYARSDLKSDQAPPEVGNSSLPYLSPNNPFRNRAPQVLVSQAKDEDYGYEDHHHYNHTADRQPLEREVSEALRRASNFSTYSNGSIATSVLEHYVQFHSDFSSTNGMGLLRRHIENSPPSDPGLVEEETRYAAAQALAFYEKGAIPSDNWVASHQHNEVRIPIKQNKQPLNSPPISPQDLVEMDSQSQGNPLGAGDDLNDWETVGESAFGTEFKGSTPGMLGDGMAQRAGSSVADTSDAGTTSTHIPEISNYGSTERIAQHPANIHYFGDYRQRDLKNSHIPVFLPVFREHKVNGYLADSNRTRPPPNPYATIPTPLTRKHTNPFKSPPPEVLAVGVSNPYPALNHDQRTRKPYHSPTATTLKTYTSSDDSTKFTEQVDRTPQARLAPAAETRSEPYDWMDDFGEPGPEINHSKHTFLKPIPSITEEDRPSSWQHIMTYAAGGSVQGYSQNGVCLHESPFGTQGGRGVMREQSLAGLHFSGTSDIRRKPQTDGFVEAKTYASKASKNLRERNTLVKGPPGAFYHGLSRPKKIDRSQSHDTERPPKVRVPYRGSSAREYPTNSLRPLSLVASCQRERPVTPIDSVGPDPSIDTIPNDFIYRSPLAPPKRKSWQKLYTPEHLSEIREAAKTDGIFNTRASQAAALHTGLLHDGIKEGGSRKHLWESPRLFQWNQEPSARTDVAQQKKKISNIVLCLCNMFPPLLLLFGLGALDGIISWWTSGEAVAFGKSQKRTALILLICWGCATFTGLVVFLIYWFTTSHS